MGERLSEAILQQVAAASREALIVVDRHDAVVWANEAATALDLEGLRHGRLLPLARSNLHITRVRLSGESALTLVTVRELEKSPPLAAEIAHELASSVSTLSLAIALSNGNDPERGREETRLVLRQLEHLLADLRAAAGALPSLGSQADVQLAAELSAQAAGAALLAHRASVSVKLEAPVIVQADQGALERVLTHLVVNAARAIDDSSGSRTIRIETCVEDPWLAIDVVDTGQGIAREQLEHLFDVADTGIGLAICKRLVSEMGGELELRSRVGVGTCARVRLRPA
jgi:signal transduction histidine kinase